MQKEFRIKQDDEPLYSRVAKILLDEITAGVFKNEERLPSEEKLGKMFGVSRATIREALSALERQGQLQRVQGLGTILTHKPKIPMGTGMERLGSYTDYVKQYGVKPGTRSVDFHWEETRPKFQELFGPETTHTGVLTRTRTADDEPLMISKDIIPMEILGPEFQLSYMGESLFQYLEHRGLVLAYSEMIISAIAADEDLAHRLDVDPGTPLLVIDETYFNNKNDVVLWSWNVYRVDRWEFRWYRSSSQE